MYPDLPKSVHVLQLLKVPFNGSLLESKPSPYLLPAVIFQNIINDSSIKKKKSIL